MATNREPPVVGSRGSILMKTIVTMLIVFLVMISITILVIWLSIKPKKPVYYIKNGSIQNYNLDKNYHLNASYNFVLDSFNPNKKMHLRYKKMDIKVLFKNEIIASGVIDSWHQHKRERRIFNLNLVSHNVELSSAVSQQLEVAKSSDHIAFDVKLKSRLRSKLGIWKSRYYHMKISCVNVEAHLSNSSKGSRGTWCDVDI